MTCPTILHFFLPLTQQPFVELVHCRGTADTIRTVSAFTICHLLQRNPGHQRSVRGHKGLFWFRASARLLRAIINCLARGKAKAVEGNQKSGLSCRVLWTMLWQFRPSLPQGDIRHMCFWEQEDPGLILTVAEKFTWPRHATQLEASLCLMWTGRHVACGGYCFPWLKAHVLHGVCSSTYSIMES